MSIQLGSKGVFNELHFWTLYWFLKFEVFVLNLRLLEFYKGNNATLVSFQFIPYLELNPNVNSLGPNLASQPVRSLKFGVASILDPNVTPPLQSEPKGHE